MADRRRRWLGGVLLLLVLPAGAPGQTVATAVECRSGGAGVAEQEICASVELRQLNEDIDTLTRRLEARLSGRERDALMDTEPPFVTQRNSCQNVRDALRICIERVLNARRGALAAALKSPASILEEIDRYEFLSVAFFRKYGERLVGRRVSVFGCMTLDPGPTPDVRTTGVIRESCSTGTGEEIPVRFRSMTAIAAPFYDVKKPASHWTGIVEQREGRIVLSRIEP